MKLRSYLTSIALILVLVAQALPTGPVSAAAYCDWAGFVADVTVPDGTAFAPSATFAKTWRLKNIGTCTWSTSYALVFDSGTQMGASSTVNLPASVAPGQLIDVTVNMTAPSNSGTFRGYWKMRNANGVIFGIGSGASSSFWVEINVSANYGSTYDFAANAQNAVWKTGSQTLTFPGSAGDAKGYVIKQDQPRLENGVYDNVPGLLTAPQNIYNGYIQGTYPAVTVQRGDRFQTIVNCEYGATNCYVTFRLDYQIGGGAVKTLWAFRERYEGLYYRADVSLDALAGQNVTFILTVLASGEASGDRALWGNPRIVRAGGPPPITYTPTSTVTGTPPTQPNCTDKAGFVSDVSVPDGTTYAAGTAFTKTWRLKNIGTCTWTTGYNLVFSSGEKMSGPDSIALPKSVPPGQTVDVSVNLTAPANSGTYRGNWMLRSASLRTFGLGSSADKAFWVEIKVTGGGSSGGSGYDFVANACSAKWISGSGTLPCFGSNNDARGFVLKLDAPKLENGVTDTRAGLLTFPQNIYNGYIQGTYPGFDVKQGDRFQAVIGCEYGATDCYVTYRLDYQIGSETIKSLWIFRERYEGQYYQADIDLSLLAGKNVKFILTILATGYATGDRAMWVAPRIYRPGAVTGTSTYTPTPTRTVTGTPPSPTATSTPTMTPTGGTPISSVNWATYQNIKYGYSVKVPSPPIITGSDPSLMKLTLPIPSGTNLIAEYVDISSTENVTSCTSSGANADPNKNQNVTVNNVTFLRQEGTDQGAGQIRDWVAYSTLRGTTCISLLFVMHSGNLGAYSTPPTQFNKDAEIAVFTEMMKTFILNSGPYSVINIASTDVLNIRSAAGASNQVVGTFAYNETRVYRTGPTAQADSAKWYEVVRPDGGKGWVNSSYLNEYVSSAAFCADSKVTTLLNDFKTAMTGSNGSLFSSLVSPVHGVNISYVANNPVINISRTLASNAFTSTTSYDWGAGPGGGTNVSGTFKDVIQPKVLDVLTNAGYAPNCDTPQVGSATNWSAAWPAQYSNLHYYSLWKPATAGVDFDYRAWVVGIEYIDGKPYIMVMMQFEWAP
jgi:hypothetical protein